MAHPYKLSFSEEDKALLLSALDLAAQKDSELYKAIEGLRDRTKGSAGAYEFRGLFCNHCNEHTPHRRKYKSNDRLVCDECGKQN